MPAHDIAARRLRALNVTRQDHASLAAVVSALLAVQAQDYNASQWAIGLRLPGSTASDIDRAVNDGSIVRTWPMRNTLHFVAAADVRWLLSLHAPRMIGRASPRYHQLGLDAKTLDRAFRVITDALTGGRMLTRAEIAALLISHGVNADSHRLIHILQRTSLEGIICHAARRGKQFTIALIDEWIPRDASPTRDRDAALAELAFRYFVSHGPASFKDYVWWSGLTVADARTGLEAVAPMLREDMIDGASYWSDEEADASDTHPSPRGTPQAVLLPAYDEYLVGYTDRRAATRRLSGPALNAVKGVAGLMSPTIVIDGQVVGTWRRTLTRSRLTIEPQYLTRLTPQETQALHPATQRLKSFLDPTP